MSADAAAMMRERRLWMALGASAVLQVFTLALVVMQAGSGGGVVAPAAGGGAMPFGRGSASRQLLATPDVASFLSVEPVNGSLVITGPVVFKGGKVTFDDVVDGGLEERQPMLRPRGQMRSRPLGGLANTLPAVSYSFPNAVNAMFYAQWLKVDTLARLTKVYVENTLKVRGRRWAGGGLLHWSRSCVRPAGAQLADHQPSSA